jgi:hypothetical protein
MALIDCKECGNPCSQDTELCLKCGYKYPTLDDDERKEKLIDVAELKIIKVLAIPITILLLLSLSVWIWGSLVKFVAILPFAIGLILILILVGYLGIKFLPLTLGLVSAKDFLLEKLAFIAALIFGIFAFFSGGFAYENIRISIWDEATFIALLISIFTGIISLFLLDYSMNR